MSAALKFWFAKALVDVGIFVGIVLLFAVVLFGALALSSVRGRYRRWQRERSQ